MSRQGARASQALTVPRQTGHLLVCVEVELMTTSPTVSTPAHTQGEGRMLSHTTAPLDTEA